MAVCDEAIVLCNRMAEDSPEDMLDVRVQAEWICEELRAAGYRARMLPFGLDAVGELVEASRRGGCFVVNMVDSGPREENFAYLAPSILEAVGIPFTGCGAEAVLVTTNKPLTKRLLASHGLPTPAWTNENDGFAPGCYLIKPACEDASVGLTDQSLVEAQSAEALTRLIAERERLSGVRCFAERFIDGREFNVCVYGGWAHPVVLPPYEWIFPGFQQAGKPCFINYNAKWVENTFEYDQLAAVYHLPPEDEPLIRELVPASPEACWQAVRAERLGTRRLPGGRRRQAMDPGNQLQPQLLRLFQHRTGARLPVRPGHPGRCGCPDPERMRNMTDRVHVSGYVLKPGEDGEIRAVTESAGVFYPEEVDIAEELARENLNRGAHESGYHFLVAESGGEVCGYTCFGPIPGARRRYDLYWIAVSAKLQGQRRGQGTDGAKRSEPS